ncbi:hypothetical protein KBY58_11895 [Cyanobium sp. HWJ4-Hawea]|uniref:cupin domain-containing protein n=1 Tax=Cyanobium sp. HWJ4-Hawea TaxID=2823713 RepID=UPI0020CF5F50|nr:cupin domain-containing protein [Cyanobium sp. HWJ4-Hawea]MCP9810134.1 hypothetical protein [Cyanobium sp. HWJ4-Hawea]
MFAAMTCLAIAHAKPARTPETTPKEPARLELKGASLRTPRYLKNPEVKELGPGSSVTFWRTTDDTCGLYTMAEVTVAASQGAPPHLHYGDEEWFIPTKEGEIRMFSAKDKAKTYQNGELPGHNTIAEEMGSATINKGDIFYSPRAHVHYFANENDQAIAGFLHIWAPGFGMRNMFDSFKMVNFEFSSKTDSSSFGNTQQQALLEKTGLWGVPHDTSGKMVGRADFDMARGTIQKFPTKIKYLQELIDAGEACYPKDGLRSAGAS